jgi:hypothetical protein
MYMVCLAKIRSIDAQALPPLVKLRLMENEENLFDGGLYLGIGGTATALARGARAAAPRIRAGCVRRCRFAQIQRRARRNVRAAAAVAALLPARGR